MLVFAGLIAISVVGYFIAIYAEAYGGMELLGQFMAYGGVACLTIALIIWPLNYSGTEAEVERYHALKQSLENARSAEASELERAAITQQIVEYNKDLASVKYWNETIFDVFISDDLAELEPIK